MDQRQMAAKLAEKLDIPVSRAKQILDTIFDTRPGRGIIAVELDSGRKVTLRGFGTFSTRQRSQRNGRNPATGASIAIPAKKYPFFSAGKSLRERVAQ